jgi:hypothetical protein
MRTPSVNEEHGFGRLFAEEGPKLWRAVFAFVQDRAVASDAVAEASTRTTSIVIGIGRDPGSNLLRPGGV